jgi:peptide/nickel transport system permease protein
MGRYIVRRLLLFVPLALAITIVVFALLRFAPGDPIVSMLGVDYSPEQEALLRHQLGLDRPIFAQYVLWLSRVLSGDLGRAIWSRQPVLRLILNRLPTTIYLALGASTLGMIISFPLGVVSAVKKDTVIDHVSRILAILGASIPVFWFGLLLIVIFAAQLQILPAGGSLTSEGLKALILPCVALGSTFAALVTRMIRSSMLEVLSQDYIRTARSKGLAERMILYRHALKNALMPVTTVIGLQLGGLLGGAVLTETVFGLPGLGRLLIEAVNRRDYPVVQGCVLFISFFFLMTNLVVDILYAYIDPRIRYGYGGE